MEVDKLYLWDIDENEGLGVFRISQVLTPAMESDFLAFSKTSFDDYPKAAQENAKKALKWRDENPNVDCGTPVGWTRANQLAKGEPISIETINRMSAFRRHEQNKDVPYNEGCGGIMWDAWGGDEGISWAAKKAESLRNLNSENFVIEPNSDESEDEFIGRCMKIETDDFSQEQAYAICKSKWDNKDEMEKEKKKKKGNYKFSIDEEKMRVIGAILIPNKKFWRNDIEGWAMFSKDAVEKARATFKKNNNMFSVNVEHSDNGAPAFLLEDWIVENTEGDKTNSKFGLSYEEGTWVGVMQITDKNYWNDFIKSGKVKGFSIELDKESVVQKKLLSMEKKNIEKLGEATLQDGTPVYWEGDTLEVGMGLFMDSELTQPAPDGEHVDGSGNVIVTRDGLVVEIRPMEEAPAEEASNEEVKEFALKSEMTTLISELTARIEKLESELVKKNEELSKEVKELKSNTPGGKSFVFKKDSKKVEEFKAEKVEKYSDRLKKTFKELGKL